jgi:hypothetical protein
MLNSLVPDIAVEALTKASEVWDTLSNLYSGKGNIMLIAEIEDKVHDLQQGDKTVMAYVAELQHLWGDLDHVDPLELVHSECVTVASWIERRHVIKFLKGLNREFEGRQAALLHQTTTPSLKDAIAAMSREEVRLKMTKSSDSVPRPAFYTSERREMRDCYTYGVKGHLKHQCTSFVTPGKGRGGYSQEEAVIEEEVMVEVVDISMGSNMVEVVNISMGNNMVEVVDISMDNNTNSSTLHLPKHIWQQLQRSRLVPHRDRQRKKNKRRQHLGTFLTMSMQMKVILNECL